MKICNTSLADLISLKYGNKVDHERKRSKQQWSDYFDLEMVRTRNRVFAHEITTDGYDVNITIKRLKPNVKLPYRLKMLPIQKERIIDTIRAKAQAEKKALADIKKIKADLNAYNRANNIKQPPKPRCKNVKISNKELISDEEWATYTNHIGLDPGKRSLYTTFDDNNVHKSYTKNEYYEDLGLNRYNHQLKLNKNRQRMKMIDPVLAQNSFKVSSTVNYLKSLSTVIGILDKIQREYTRRFYRKSKFTKYGKKHKAYRKIFNRLLKDKNGKEGKILIGYGSGLCNGKGIGGACMPVKTFYEYLCRQDKKKCRTVKANESLSTKMCNECGHATVDVKQHKEITIKEGVKKMMKVKIYALRRCSNNECRITWDRDINASRNIHNILKTEHRGQARPKYLCFSNIKTVSKGGGKPVVLTHVHQNEGENLPSTDTEYPMKSESSSQHEQHSNNGVAMYYEEITQSLMPKEKIEVKLRVSLSS